MAAKASLIISIGGEISSLDRATKAAAAKIQGLASQIQTAGTTLTLGITAPVLAFGKAAITAGAEIESLKLALASLEGSTAGAEKRFKELLEVAKLPGLGVREAVQADLTLRSYGLSAEKAKEATLAFGNALAAAGRGKADLAETVRQFAQLSTTSKLTAENLKPVIERVPQVAALLREKFGTANAEAIRELGVGTQEVVNTIITGLQKVPPVTGGLKNALENLTDLTEQNLARAGDALKPFVERFSKDFAEPLINKIGEAAEAFSRLPDSVQNTAAAIAGVAVTAGPALYFFGSLAQSVTNLVTLYGKLPSAAKLAGAAIRGVGYVALAEEAGSLISKVWELRNVWVDTQGADRETARLFKNAIDALSKAGADMDQFRAKYKSLIGELEKAQFLGLPISDAALKTLREANRELVDVARNWVSVAPPTKKAAGSVENLAGSLEKVTVKARQWADLNIENALDVRAAADAEADRTRRLAELRKELERLYNAAPGEGKFIARLEGLLNGLTLKGTPLDFLGGSFKDAFAQQNPFQFVEEGIELATRRSADLVAEISKIPGETRLVEEAWARVGLEIGRTKVPDDLKYFQADIFKTASESVKKGAKDFEKAQKDQERAAREAQRHIERVFHQTARAITDVIFQADSLGQAFTKLGRELLKSLATEAIERQLKRLTKTLLNWGAELGKTGLGKVLGGIFGVDLAKGGIKTAADAASGAAGVAGAAGSAASAGGSAASAAGQAAGSALSAAVGIVTGVVSAVSGVISNFQLAGVNKSLDLIEHEVRYSQIHLLNILENSNKFWPWIQYSHDRLRQMLEVGVPVFSAAGDQGLRIAGGGAGATFNFDFRGATFGGTNTREQAEEIFTELGRRFALTTGVRG